MRPSVLLFALAAPVMLGVSVAVHEANLGEGMALWLWLTLLLNVPLFTIWLKRKIAFWRKPKTADYCRAITSVRNR